MISILVTTKNESLNLADCLDCVSFCDDIVVLDSYSEDGTPDIASVCGARVYQRRFDDYASNLNYALTAIPYRHRFVFVLDADERVSPQLADNLVRASQESGDIAAFRVKRRDFFHGRVLRRVQTTPLYVRLLRPEKVHFTRLVHQQAVVDGPLADVDGWLDHYPFSKGLAQWLDRHRVYAEFEAQQCLLEMRARPDMQSMTTDMHVALFAKDFNRRRQAQKRIFSRLPCRWLIRFAYFMFARAGFLDGWPGISYIILMSWYEYRISIIRRRLRSSSS
ncbi:glycosyltransferase family 2 protein [Desulfovibrio inopinatus]|uniref:glycosyltransferase family 2 protein n=1 Tax=Desulfovibrio inopinatus TaxID=102109 RepID=UPI000480B554|nr:glycosyltransferase family 2 protein [Desulfovibrio inopinatus]